MNNRNETTTSEIENTPDPELQQYIETVNGELEESKIKIRLALEFYQTLLVEHAHLTWRKAMLEADISADQDD